MFASAFVELRAQIKQLFNRHNATGRYTRRSYTDSQRSASYHGEIVILPAIVVNPAQDQDPTSDTYGQMYFVFGVSSFDTPLGRTP